MDNPRPGPNLPAESSVGSAEWTEISEIVAASLPDDGAEVWLGQVVIEVQRASDRAVARARDWARGHVAAAHAEAAAISGTAPPGAPTPPPPVLLVPAAPWRGEPASADIREPARSPVPSPGKAPPCRDFIGAGAENPLPVQTPPAALAAAPTPEPEPIAGPGRSADRRGVALALAVILVAGGYVGFERYATAFAERRSQNRLSAVFAHQKAKPAPTGVAPGAALGLLNIPKIGLYRQVVVEGATLVNLRRGPAHDAASARPGQPGAVVIIGHRRTYGGPLARIGNLRPGDTITLRTPSGQYAYLVRRDPETVRMGQESTFALPSANEVRVRGGDATHIDQALVLATGVSSGNSELRVVVATLDQATPIGTAGPPAAAVDAALQTVPGQPAGLLEAGFWTLLLGGVAFAAWRLRQRWSPRLVYPVAVMAVVLVVYQGYVAIDRLLPGTY